MKIEAAQRLMAAPAAADLNLAKKFIKENAGIDVIKPSVSNSGTMEFDLTKQQADTAIETLTAKLGVPKRTIYNPHAGFRAKRSAWLVARNAQISILCATDGSYYSISLTDWS
jgi:hypothetical protein